MTREGVDFAWSKPDVGALHANHKDFVVGYISHDPSKDLNKAQIENYVKNGISVCLVFESTGGRAAQGYAAGKADAEYARAQQKARGITDRPIPFAVDFDASVTQVRQYFRGVRDTLGKDHAGVYGSFKVCAGLKALGLVGFCWQTYAWSLGAWFIGAQLRQYKNDVHIGGASVDLDRAMKDDFGQWPHPKKAPYADHPTLVPGRKGDKWVVHLRRLAYAKGWPQVHTGKLFTRRHGFTKGKDSLETVIKGIQKNHHLVQDGIVGPKTWPVMHQGINKKKVAPTWLQIRKEMQKHK